MATRNEASALTPDMLNALHTLLGYTYSDYESPFLRFTDLGIPHADQRALCRLLRQGLNRLGLRRMPVAHWFYSPSLTQRTVVLSLLGGGTPPLLGVVFRKDGGGKTVLVAQDAPCTYGYLWVLTDEGRHKMPSYEVRRMPKARQDTGLLRAARAVWPKHFVVIRQNINWTLVREEAWRLP